MSIKPKLIRITTVPLSLDKLLEGQLAFMKDHFEITAISADETYLKKIAEREGVKYFPISLTRAITPINDILAVVKLYRFFKKEKPEIVHTHTPKAGIVGMLAARIAGVPVRLHTVAGLPLLEASGLKRKLLSAVEKYTYYCATHVYPNSFGLKEIIVTEGFAQDDELKVLANGSSNGINTAYFNPERYSTDDHKSLRLKLGIPLDHMVFIFVGRLVGDKGINEMVQAFNEVQKIHPKVSLVLVGPQEAHLDPLLDDTNKIIAEHPYIHTAGYQDDVRPYYAFAKALLFPSYREGFPNVVLQAGAMGLPSIVSDINGCNEIIKEGFNGSIIPPKNEEALKAVMLSWLTHPEKMDAMAKNTRDHIVNHYDRTKVWEALLTEYDLCLK